ncbi:MAG: S9 family peptidase, partial [Acidobacteria bacterium]|nr:S9 family peptidase [Acidobacteriota bacterium]
MRAVYFAIVVLIVVGPVSMAAEAPSSEIIETLEGRHEALRHQVDALSKSIDDLLWFHRVGDVSVVDKVRIYGPSRWKEANPDAIGAGNPVKFYAYLFTPKNLADAGKLPLLVLPHG